MKSEESVQIDSRVGSAVWLGNRDRWPQFVIPLLAERHYHVQAVDRAALKDRDQDFLAGFGRFSGEDRARQPGRQGADAEHRERGAFQEHTSGWHCSYLF